MSVFLIFCQSCSQNHLTVQQEWIDQKYLASSFTKTPDPKKLVMEKGQMLTIGWDYPLTLFDEKLTMQLQIRFWNGTEKLLHHDIRRKRDFISYFFSKERILTYRIDIFTKEEALLESWIHQLWTPLISPESHELSKLDLPSSAN